MLKRIGVTIRKTIDVRIATFCLEHGYELLHNDKDYEPMQAILGLQGKQCKSLALL
jgi:predicted nucleic acid-binding protein